MKRTTRSFAVLLFLVLLASTASAGCATVKGWVAGPSAGKALIMSGETLDATSLLFETWSKDFAARCAPPKPTLSASICNKSADFQGYFRPSFHNASALWRVAVKAREAAIVSGDEQLSAGATAKQKDAEKIVNDLRNELLARLASGGK
jgi:predicted small secreted protein